MKRRSAEITSIPSLARSRRATRDWAGPASCLRVPNVVAAKARGAAVRTPLRLTATDPPRARHSHDHRAPLPAQIWCTQPEGTRPDEGARGRRRLGLHRRSNRRSDGGTMRGGPLFFAHGVKGKWTGRLAHRRREEKVGPAGMAGGYVRRE
jgi:hypothetical protein